MKCPQCGAAASDGAAECPSCGVIFAKLKEKREKDLLAAKQFLAASAAPPEPMSPWVGRAIAAALASAWLAVMGYFLWRAFRVNSSRRRVAPVVPAAPGEPGGPPAPPPGSANPEAPDAPAAPAAPQAPSSAPSHPRTHPGQVF